MMLKSGEIILENFISHSDLNKVVEKMSKLPAGAKYSNIFSTYFKSIGIGHVLYKWFNKIIFKKIRPPSMSIRNFPVNPKIILKKSPDESKGTKNQDSDMVN